MHGPRLLAEALSAICEACIFQIDTCDIKIALLDIYLTGEHAFRVLFERYRILVIDEASLSSTPQHLRQSLAPESQRAIAKLYRERTKQTMQQNSISVASA